MPKRPETTPLAYFLRSLRVGWVCYLGSALLAALLLFTRLLEKGAMRPYFGDVILLSVPLCWAFAPPVACAAVFPSTANPLGAAAMSSRCMAWALFGSFCVCSLPVIAVAGVSHMAATAAGSRADDPPGVELVWAVVCAAALAGDCLGLVTAIPAFLASWFLWSHFCGQVGRNAGLARLASMRMMLVTAPTLLMLAFGVCRPGAAPRLARIRAGSVPCHRRVGKFRYGDVRCQLGGIRRIRRQGQIATTVEGVDRGQFLRGRRVALGFLSQHFGAKKGGD